MSEWETRKSEFLHTLHSIKPMLKLKEKLEPKLTKKKKQLIRKCCAMCLSIFRSDRRTREKDPL